jgi:hypothetical protein
MAILTTPNLAGAVSLPTTVTSPATAAAARLAAAGLNPGGVASTSTSAAAPTVSVNNSSVTNQDWRVKISVSPSAGIFNGTANPFLAPLVETVSTGATLGVVFPYVPSISVQHNARYSTQELTHSNYNSYFYKGSDISQISIQSEFTVQNIDEGQYLLAAIHFFRSVTKMFWGNDTNPLAGNPPPIVFLDGYGDYYFPHVTCVVTQFQHTMDSNTDYVQIPFPNNPQQTAWLPAISSITVNVQPVYSRQNVYDNLTLSGFSQGQLLNKGFI